MPSKTSNNNLTNIISNSQPVITQQNENLSSTNQEGLEKELSSSNLTNDKFDQKSSINYNLSLSRYIELRSHFDVIRKLGYLQNLNALVSISEDCLIKVWSLNNVHYSNAGVDLEPYLVLRGHTGPLFSLAVGLENSNLIYTAGNEGIIKIWNVLRQDEVAQYGDTDSILNCNVGFFQKPNEVVWEMKHHPKAKILVSLSADSSLCIWETATAEEYIQALNGKNRINEFFI